MRRPGQLFIGAMDEEVSVTFKLNTVLGSNLGQYFLGGGVFGGANAKPMTQDPNDPYMWSVQVTLTRDTEGTFAFFDTPLDEQDWGKKEYLVGQDCALPDRYNDRALPILDGDATSYEFEYVYGYCGSTAPSPDMYSAVTLEITASESVENLHIGGGFFGFANGQPCPYDEEAGVYRITKNILRSYSGGFFAFYNNPTALNDWGTKEDLSGKECAAGEYNDRALPDLTEEAHTFKYVFGECVVEEPEEEKNNLVKVAIAGAGAIAVGALAYVLYKRQQVMGQ